MKRYNILFCSAAVFLTLSFCAHCCYGSDESIAEMRKEIDFLKNKISDLEKKLDEETKRAQEERDQFAKQKEDIKALKIEFEHAYDTSLIDPSKKLTFETDDLKINVQGTFIGQGVNNANLYGSEKKDKFDGSTQIDLLLEKQFRKIDGKGHFNLRAGEGKGADRVLILYSGADNNKAPDRHLWVTSLYYQQFLFDRKFLVDFGKIDPTDFFDINRLAGSDTTRFLACIFNNNPVIEFPAQNMALRLGLIPIEQIEMTYMAFNGNIEWQDIDDHLFNIAQMTFKPKFFEREGYYRFMAWSNSNDHTEWSSGDTGKSTYGFALSFDQDVNDFISLFTRYGWENPKVYNPDIVATGDNILSLEQSWSAGIQLTGKPWGRIKDLFGFAVGQVIPSDDYKKALDRKGRSEGHLEIYYDIFINEYICVTPDFQYIINPYGKDVIGDPDPVFVYAIRAYIDF